MLRWLNVLVILGLLLSGGVPVAVPVQAMSAADPQEPNDNSSQAFPLVSGYVYFGAIADVYDRDWFTFEVSSNGLFEATLTEHEIRPAYQGLELCLFNDRLHEVSCVSASSAVHYLRHNGLAQGRY